MGGDNGRWRPPSLLWIPLFICTVLLFVINMFQLKYYITSPTIIPKGLGYLIETSGCRILDIDPFDSSIRHCIEKEEQPICNKGLPSLVESNFTSLYVNISSLRAYGINDRYQLKCCYGAFWRKEPEKNQRDNKFEVSKYCIEFHDSIDIKEEFVVVDCNYNNISVYKDLFAFTPLKNYTKPQNLLSDLLNVLVIGLDAVSRLNLHRQLPKTVDYLRKLNTIELLGYNKVGDNTFPNLIPVLTGLTESELEKTCWASKGHFDSCPFLWKDFKRNGFVTSFAEDAAWMGIFNYQKKGFKIQPTDYMWGFFNRIAENQIGNAHKMNVYQCVGSRPVYKTFIDYIKKFVKTMCHEKRPYFSFFWSTSLSHDFLNMPSLGDDDYKNLFKELYRSGCLNQTVLIFMSDHGFRWGKIRLTYQGRMEEKLPFVNFILPKWYKKKIPRAVLNLHDNVRRLTTPFDLHETLKDFLRPYEINDKAQNTKPLKIKRGYSLFEKIPFNRTCDSAGIASHWCACRETIVVNKSDSTILKAANYTVNYMNSLLESYNDCAKLNLDEIINAHMHTHDKHILNGYNNTVDYTLTLKTVPGDGIFEVTVRTHINENRFNITGTISRLNLYDKQSLCITDFHLKLYCYCKNLL